MAFQNAMVLFEDYVASATLTNGSYEEDLPLDNVKDDDIDLPARTTDATVESTVIDIDFGADKQIDALVLRVPNISPGARYRVRSYNESGRTTVAYDSLEKSMPGFVVPSLSLSWDDPNWWFGVNTEGILTEFAPWIIEVIPDARAADAKKRYWRIEIIDTGNVDGYLDIGRLMAGGCFKPRVNYDEDNSFGVVPLTDMSESLGGKRTYFERGIRRTLQLSFKFLSWEEGFGDAFRMMVKARDSRQVFVIPEYSDATFLQERAFLATFEQLSKLQQILVDRSAITLNFTEVL